VGSPETNRRHSRNAFLGRTAVAGGAVAAGGLLFDRLSRAAPASSAAEDVRVLNLALLIEYVEAAFYAEARAKGALRGELRQYADVVGGHEQKHVAFLKQALGARARKPPKLAFGKATTHADAFVRSAVTIEETVVAAYNGQATNLSPAALAAAARIVSVEARHAAWIRSIAGELPAAHPTDSPMTEAQALAALRKTGFLRSS
jgi:rubrerythrin